MITKLHVIHEVLSLSLLVNLLGPPPQGIRPRNYLMCGLRITLT